MCQTLDMPAFMHMFWWKLENVLYSPSRKWKILSMAWQGNSRPESGRKKGERQNFLLAERQPFWEWLLVGYYRKALNWSELGTKKDIFEEVLTYFLFLNKILSMEWLVNCTMAGLTLGDNVTLLLSLWFSPLAR